MIEDVEVWKDVHGFPGYRVSSWARVSGKMVAILKTRDCPHGYAMVWLSIGGIVTAKKVATLVCEAFHGPRPTPKTVCAHNDGDKKNNRPENLRWASQKENMADTLIHGTRYHHDRHLNAILSTEKVKEIRRRHTEAKIGRSRVKFGFMTDLAKEFGVDARSLGKVVRHEIWKGI